MKGREGKGQGGTGRALGQNTADVEPWSKRERETETESGRVRETDRQRESGQRWREMGKTESQGRETDRD